MQLDGKMDKVPDELLEEVSGGEASKYAKNVYYKVIGGNLGTVQVHRYDDHGNVKGYIKVGQEVVAFRGWQATVTNNGVTMNLICVAKENSSDFFWMEDKDLQKILPW